MPAGNDLSQIMVSVFCIAYNHERYIAQCLESLINQDTEYQYEILVHDDASADRTAEIVRAYEQKHPNLIKAVYQSENQYSKGGNLSSRFLFPLARGKYLLTCEGDDFWTDPLKLQKQIEYMEKHPECAMCGHGAFYANEDGSIVNNKFFCKYDTDRVLTFPEILSGWPFATNTRIYRSEFYPKDGVPYRGDCPNGDQALIIWYGLHGEVHYLAEKMSAYRWESIGSLTWTYRHDNEKWISSKKKYISMLHRIDEYTNGQYSDIISQTVKDVEFDMYFGIGDLKNMRRHKDSWQKLSMSTRVKIYVKHFVPWLKPFIKKVKGKLSGCK